MKTSAVILILIFLTACNYTKVKKEYKKDNPFAKEIMLSGLTYKVAEYLDDDILEEALKGDEEATQIIIAQINSLKGMPKEHHTVVPIITPRATYRSGGHR